MVKSVIGFVLLALVGVQVSATPTIKVKRDSNWPDLKVAVDNTWPDCKIKFESNWPDVIVSEDNNWPDVKVKQDQTWSDIKVTEDSNWPDVKVGGTRDLILAAVACPGVQKYFRAMNSAANVKVKAFSKPTWGQVSCEVTDHGGSVDAMCGVDTPIRCYSEVKFSNGAKGTIYGKDCWESLSDCFSIGQGAFDPCD